MSLMRSPLLRVVVRRLSMAVPLLFVVSALTFLLVSLTPGDAADAILGVDAPPDAHERLERALGLDRPLYEQYWRWLRAAVGGDLGTSLFSSESVWGLIAARASVTVWLAVGALLVSVLVGVALGVTSAVRRGVVGRLVDVFALVGWALPAFWVGAMLITVFAVRLRWLPATGYVPVGESATEWLRSLVLPVVALSLGGVAAVTKQTREAMLDTLGSEYVRMAVANGIGRGSVVFQHALKNAGIRVLTVVGVLAVSLLGGTVLVERVFALPGLGSLAVNSSIQHDLPVVQGLVVVATAVVVLVNLAIDVAYALLDPRVRAE